MELRPAADLGPDRDIIYLGAFGMCWETPPKIPVGERIELLYNCRRIVRTSIALPILLVYVWVFGEVIKNSLVVQISQPQPNH